jgi:CNT family concentrative nucleoside transporter
MQSFMSIVGMVGLLVIAYLLSTDRKAINRRTVATAFALQAGIAALILFVPSGSSLLDVIVKGVQHVIDFGNDGIDFVFGADTRRTLGFTIALNVLPVIVFFSALMSVLYYFGVMQWVIAIIGGWLHRLLKTSHTGSMSAVANIFIGHTEAPLVVRPYLAGMSQSELFAVMTGGCATIAGAVMAAYANLGVDLKYLITASFMAAPGGLLMAKMLMPETEQRDIKFDPSETGGVDKPVNIFDAIGNGAATGLTLALNVGAMLLAFVAMIGLLNGILGGIGGWFGMGDLTLQGILGWAFAPVAFMVGVPWDEAMQAGSLIGQKLVVTEFYAYISFVEIKESLSAHTQLVVTFALCGFANFTSIAILLGGLGSIVPSRRQDVAKLGLRAVVGGTLANLMSAALAGLFFSLQ